LKPQDAPTGTPPRKDADSCQCESKKKKPKKKSKPREVCYRGTYTQRARGITYNPREEVPCTTEKPTRARRKTNEWPISFPDILRGP